MERLITDQIQIFRSCLRQNLQIQSSRLTADSQLDLLGSKLLASGITFVLLAFFQSHATLTDDSVNLILERLLKIGESAPDLLSFLTAITIPDGLSESRRENKLIATCIALSVLLTTRSQKFAGISKALGVALVLGGASENLIEILNKARFSCSHRTATDVLDATDVDEELKQVCYLLCCSS
jgi:hypothetical protein